MKSLIEILKSETSSLKTQYIEKTLAYADLYFKTLEERKTWNDEKWAEFLNVETRIATEGNKQYKTFFRGFYNSPVSREYTKFKNEISNVLYKGLEDYKKQKKQDAELHYIDSINKLASRILKKNLEIENISIKTSQIGVNIESIISDGKKTITAFTIIAEGQIQAPHYRYLIK